MPPPRTTKIVHVTLQMEIPNEFSEVVIQRLTREAVTRSILDASIDDPMSKIKGLSVISYRIVQQ